jgi:hypothetical protein
MINRAARRTQELLVPLERDLLVEDGEDDVDDLHSGVHLSELTTRAKPGLRPA